MVSKGNQKLMDALRVRHQVDPQLLEEAEQRLQESGERTPQHLARILYSEFNVPHDHIYGTLAELYAFQRISLTVEQVDEKTQQHTKEILQEIPEDLRNKLLYNKEFAVKTLLYKFER